MMCKTHTPKSDRQRRTPPGSDRVAKEASFSLHAGASVDAPQRDKLERLCRYVSRPEVSETRLALTSNGNLSFW
jgi:hypothetical protein